MLAILTTHPIQYQVLFWQALARDGGVPFEVWFLTKHGVEQTLDREFGKGFAWDLPSLEGYPYRFIQTSAGATPNSFWQCRVVESWTKLFNESGVTTLWVLGWQVAAYWQGVWAANHAGLEVWLRGESNILKEQGARSREQGAERFGLKRRAKRILLGQLFTRVDHFLCIGAANRELYRSYGVPESKLHMAPYTVDNDRFAKQAEALRASSFELRASWNIPRDAFVVLFCGKFIPKKHPLDLIKAAQLLLKSHPELKVHLLFVGSGELGAEMRANCKVVLDTENPISDLPSSSSENPRATFAGFLNQTEISKAYVAADVLVLPSDYAETWGLVVNEAMVSGLKCIISDHCGCAVDLGRTGANETYPFGDIENLADVIYQSSLTRGRSDAPNIPSLSTVVSAVCELAGVSLPVTAANQSRTLYPKE